MSHPSPIPWLLCRTLLELAALPFHVAAFLVRRGRIRREVAEVLATQARPQDPA